MSREQITLDVIPIHVNQMYPTHDMIYHFTGDRTEDMINYMIGTIHGKFSDCDTVIILEKGKVVKVL